MNAIILHGMPSREEYYNPESEAQSNKHWIPWLQRQLILKDILAQTPELPRPYAPDYAAWKSVFETLNPSEESILIGHSCGAGFLLRWLTETRTKAKQLVLVAPWINPRNDPVTEMFRFELKDLGAQIPLIDTLISTDDDPDVQLSAERIAISQSPDVHTTHRWKDKGHFTENDLGTREFPELLQLIVGG